MAMILRIGSKPKRFLNSSQNGFTFVEVMVTIAVLSLGIVMIFKTFSLSLDQLVYLSDRLYATTLIDNRIVKIERMLKAYRALPYETDGKEEAQINGRTVLFKQKVSISEVEGFSNIFKLDLTLSWNEHGRDVALKRSTYIIE